MTASTLNSADAGFSVPGAYELPRPHPAPQLPVRTDVAGFVGFEPRVRGSTTPSTLTGAPPTGHIFRIDVATFQVEIRGRPVQVPGGQDVIVSADPATTLVADGQTTFFAVAVATRFGTSHLVITRSTVAPQAPPSDDEVRAAVLAWFAAEKGKDGRKAPDGAERDWLRVADVCFMRSGNQLWTTVHPALTVTRCDEWRDFLLAFGEPVDDGTYLASAVRAFFANGGGRCYVVTVRRPVLIESSGEALKQARLEMIGVAGSSLDQATGLERLLHIEEVGIVDLPDLHVRRVCVSAESFPLPSSEQDVCFAACPPAAEPAKVPARSAATVSEPLYSMKDVYESQRDLVARCMPLRWRVLALLSPPVTVGTLGLYEPPHVKDAEAWRNRFLQDASLGSGENSEAHRLSCAAMYFPWVQAQEGLDAPLKTLPPTPFAAGVMARRDLARGPHVAPANEPLVSVIALSPRLSDEQLGRLYEPPATASGSEVPGINAFRVTPGRGVLIWGARTLSIDKWLRYVSVRRCLSAIERRCKVGLEAVVFEPNSPATWAQVTQLVLGVLQPIYEAGGLRGATPMEAFYVRCDETINPPDRIQAGYLFCEVGVAIAAPAEFIVFRLGRQEGVTEITE